MDICEKFYKGIYKGINQSFDKDCQAKSNILELGWRVLAGMALSLAIAAPSFAENTISLGRNFRDDPRQLTGIGGGSRSLASIAKIADNCRGFANKAPNHTIKLTDTFPVLDFLVASNNINDDPTMLIKGPNGLVVCADDESKGRFPQVTRRLTKGEYQIWVGSKTTNQSFEYTLYLSETRQK
jgi:hypothetical protein